MKFLINETPTKNSSTKNPSAKNIYDLIKYCESNKNIKKFYKYAKEDGSLFSFKTLNAYCLEAIDKYMKNISPLLHLFLKEQYGEEEEENKYKDFLFAFMRDKILEEWEKTPDIYDFEGENTILAEFSDHNGDFYFPHFDCKGVKVASLKTSEGEVNSLDKVFITFKNIQTVAFRSSLAVIRAFEEKPEIFCDGYRIIDVPDHINNDNYKIIVTKGGERLKKIKMQDNDYIIS